MRALVVEDSRSTRIIIAEILRELGFDVVEADNGRSGLDRLRQHRDLVLAVVDWNMPELDGLSFVRAVKGERAFGQTRLLMITAANELGYVSEALAAGADEYLMKPFTSSMVAEKLAILGLAP